MITIYHNTRCSKSRSSLDKIKDSGKEYKIREYLKEPLSKPELKKLIKKLNIQPIELVRTNENLWKEEYRNKELTADEIIDILVENPRLIERPIVENEQKAVIGRPSEKIDEIIKSK